MWRNTEETVIIGSFWANLTSSVTLGLNFCQIKSFVGRSQLNEIKALTFIVKVLMTYK
jgi:hypothetical protein